MEETKNRFKLARTQFNKNGKESVLTVSQKTGITKSIIDDLESAPSIKKKRGTSYLTVAKLAQYYGVSADYLLGLSDFETPDTDIQGVCRYTGLSVDSVKNILKYRELIKYLNDVLSLDDLPIFLDNLAELKICSKRADQYLAMSIDSMSQEEIDSLPAVRKELEFQFWELNDYFSMITSNIVNFYPKRMALVSKHKEAITHRYGSLADYLGTRINELKE